MTPASDNLEPPSWLKLEHFFQRFEAAWQTETNPDLTAFLPKPDAPNRAEVLRELVKIDLEYRWRRGEAKRVEAYLQRFPELADGAGIPVDLLQEEIRVRRQHGAMPSEAELCQRFPEDCAAVTALLADCDAQPRPAGAAPRTMGRFELREQIGRGGFATVYRGWDPELRRDVAIKVPHAELVDSPEARERLLREAQSAAKLRHPAIVPLFEVGQEHGQAFLVYEFIPGPTLSTILKTTRPAPAQVAEWVMRLAEALEYAHQNGIVHRDVKPANVLLDQGAQPRLADFGLALQEDARATLTQEGDLLGTPAYMSPEQAACQRHAVDARSDVYSLGVLLYEGLSGQLPFQGSSVSVLHQVLHDEPKPPREIVSAAPADLETICLKAMAKEPGRRYPSAGALAEDLHRYLHHLPIAARRVGPIGRLTRWCRRKPALAATIALATAITLTVAGLSFHQVMQERDRFFEQKSIAEENLYHALVGQAKAELRARDTGWWWNAMDKIGQAGKLDVAARDPAELRELAIECMGTAHPCFRLVETWSGHVGPVRAVALAPNGQWAASGGKDRNVRLWHVATGETRGVLEGHSAEVTALAVHPNGTQLASGSTDGTLRLWKTTSPFTGEIIELQLGAVHQIAYAPDGRALAAACERGAILVDLMKSAKVRVLQGHIGAVRCVSFDSAGKLLATGSSDKTIRYWDAQSGAEVASWHMNYPITSVALAPQSKLAAWADPMTYGIGQITPGAAPLEYGALHQDAVTGLCWRNKGQLLTASQDGTLKAWTGFPPRELAIARANFGAAWCLAAAPAGDIVLAGYQDGKVRRWELAEPPHRTLLTSFPAVAFGVTKNQLVLGENAYDFSQSVNDHAQRLGPPIVSALAPHPVDDRIVIGRTQGALEIWDVTQRRMLKQWNGHDAAITALVLHPDGRSFVSSDANGWIKARDWTSAECRWKLPTGIGSVQQLAWHADGGYLAATAERGTALYKVVQEARRVEQLWCEPHLPGSSTSVAFGPDFLAVGEQGGAIAIRDPKTGQLLRKVNAHKNGVTALGFHPDRRVLASAGHDQTVRLWDVATFKEQSQVRFEGAAPSWLAFAPHGVTLAFGGPMIPTVLCDLKRNVAACRIVPPRDACGAFAPRTGDLLLGSAMYGAVRRCAPRAWEGAPAAKSDGAAGTARVDLHDFVVPGGHLDMIWGAAASPDGRWFATASHDRTVKIWDAQTLQLARTLEGHGGMVWCVAFSPDSRQLASGSAGARGGEIKLWDVASGKELQHLDGHKRLVVGLAYHAKAPLLVSADFDGALMGWETPTGQALGLLHQFDQPVHQLALHPNGDWLAAACNDHHVALWDFRQTASTKFVPRAPDKLLAGHGHSVWAVTFHTDGQLASASEDGVIILWDADTHERRVRLRNPSTRLRSLSFSPDGKLLGAGVLHERAIVWDLDRVRRTLKDMNLDW